MKVIFISLLLVVMFLGLLTAIGLFVEAGGNDRAIWQRKKDFICFSILCYCIIGNMVGISSNWLYSGVHVVGTCMEPTLEDGQHNGYCNRLSYRDVSDPKRFDIISFTADINGEQECCIKRIIGLPGETIQIKSGYVYIDGKKLEGDDFCRDTIHDAGRAILPVKLGEDEFFVMGDNREVSYDSRYEGVGNIHFEEIEGRYTEDRKEIIKTIIGEIREEISL